MQYNYTLIISHYNRPRSLERLLDTIPQRDDMQVIVVDDSSTEGLDELRSLQAKYPHCEWYATDSNGGGGKARNTGLRHARGRWLLFADSDDCYTADFDGILEEYKDKDKDYDIVYFDAIVVTADGKVNPDASRVPRVIRESAEGIPIRFRLTQTWNKLFARRIVESNHIEFEESLVSNDVYFSTLCDYYASNTRIDRRAFYVYWVHQASVAHNKSVRKALIKHEVMCRRHAFLVGHGFGAVDEYDFIGKNLRYIFLNGDKNDRKAACEIARKCGAGSWLCRKYYCRFKTEALKNSRFVMQIKRVVRCIIRH